MTQWRKFVLALRARRRPNPDKASHFAQPIGKHRRATARSTLQAGCAVALITGLGIVAVLTVGTNPDTRAAVGEDPKSQPTTPPSSTASSTVEPAPSSPTSAPASPPAPQQPATTTTTEVEVTGVSVPPGVPEQFEYFEVGDQPCSGPFADSGPTVVANGSDTAWVLEVVVLCLPGFDKFAPVDVTVFRPDGQVVPQPYDPASFGVDPAVIEEAYINFLIDVDAPTGPYEVTAQQGTTVAQGLFSVGEPVAPRLRVVSSGAADHFTVWMAGLIPGRPGNIDLYRGTGPGVYTYAGTVDVPSSDARGRAVYTFAGSIDNTGGYCLVARGGPLGCPFEGSYL
jgi:hypothetical protein